VRPRFFPYLHVFAAGCVVAVFAPGFLLRDAAFYFFVLGGPALALSLALAAPSLRRAPLRCSGFAVCSVALYEASVYAVLRAERDTELLALATAAISGLSAALFLALYCTWLGTRGRLLRALAGLPLGALASVLLRPVESYPGHDHGEAAFGTLGFVLAWYAGVALAVGALGLGPRVEPPSEGRS
jgi:hypothetical protein